jgi:hypothetical protein
MMVFIFQSCLFFFDWTDRTDGTTEQTCLYFRKPESLPPCGIALRLAACCLRLFFPEARFLSSPSRITNNPVTAAKQL